MCCFFGRVLLGLFRNRNTLNRRNLWKECGLLRIDKYAFFWEIFGGKSYAAARAGRVRRYSSSQITSDSVSRSEICRSVLFEIEIPCILLFLNRNKNSQNSPKRMHPQLIRGGTPVQFGDISVSRKLTSDLDTSTRVTVLLLDLSRAFSNTSAKYSGGS